MPLWANKRPAQLSRATNRPTTTTAVFNQPNERPDAHQVGGRSRRKTGQPYSKPNCSPTKNQVKLKTGDPRHALRHSNRNLTGPLTLSPISGPRSPKKGEVANAHRPSSIHHHPIFTKRRDEKGPEAVQHPPLSNIPRRRKRGAREGNSHDWLKFQLPQTPEGRGKWR